MSFYAYGTLKFGVNVEGAQLDADPRSELVTGPGPGVVFGPQVRGCLRTLTGGAVSAMAALNFNAYLAPSYGVQVTTGAVSSTGLEELLTGAGPGPTFWPRVRGWTFNGQVASIPTLDFMAFAQSGYGVRVRGGDMDGDGTAEIVCAPGPGPNHVTDFVGFRFTGSQTVPLANFSVPPFSSFYGGRMTVADYDADQLANLVAAPGPDPAATSAMRSFTYTPSGLVTDPTQLVAFPGDRYGVQPGQGRFHP